ncbi:MAG: long-chain fatty acid--CoA ligase [Myxococcales bacterium]|nr:long-chain fatty acid--CoA ligase [Myxococcales bacterium]
MQLYKWLTEAAKLRGSAKALVYRDTYFSWRGLQHRVERRAQEFAAMGIADGHWVGLMLGNVPDFAILALALSKLGATVVPLDPTTGSRDLSMILEAAPLRGLITRPRGGVDAAPVMPLVRGAKAPETPESRRRLQGTLLTCSIYRREKDAAPRGASVVLFTSDSSGDPRGILRSAANLEAGAQNLKTTLDVTPEDRILTTVPLYHAYGFDLGMVLALRFGATLYLEDEVAPKRIVKILREQEIDLLPGAPQLYAGLAKLPTAKPLKIKRARYLAAGSALSAATAEAFRERWGVRVMAMYHTTETMTVAVDRKGASPESVGKAADGVEVRVGAGGSMWVRSKAVAARSIGAGRPAKRSPGGAVAVGALDGEGWFRTGDLGRIDRSGRVFLAGREDDLVKVDGKRVALGEVEGCLEAFAKVKSAKARVITDPLGGPMVVARVVVLSKCGAEEIIDHCARNLASYKVPRRIEFSEL